MAPPLFDATFLAKTLLKKKVQEKSRKTPPPF